MRCAVIQNVYTEDMNGKTLAQLNRIKTVHAQKIIEEGLSRRIIEYQSLEAFKALSQSTNSKLIISNGQTPFLITPEAEPAGEKKK